MFTTIKTIDVADKTIIERLYLVPGREALGLSVNCPCASTPPTAQSVANSRFFCLFSKKWGATSKRFILSPLIFLVSTIREVILPILGTGRPRIPNKITVRNLFSVLLLTVMGESYILWHWERSGRRLLTLVLPYCTAGGQSVPNEGRSTWEVLRHYLS